MIVDRVETVCRENLARKFGNTMVFGPIDVRQRSTDGGRVLEVTATYAEVRGISVESRGAAAMAGAEVQLRELSIDNPLEHSLITENEFPGFRGQTQRSEGQGGTRTNELTAGAGPWQSGQQPHYERNKSASAKEPDMTTKPETFLPLPESPERTSGTKAKGTQPGATQVLDTSLIPRAFRSTTTWGP